jgi:hypothetical protein
MPLLNDGTNVWVPVKAEPVIGSLYRVLGPMPEDQEWQFAPDTVVSVTRRLLSDSIDGLAVVGDAPAAQSSEIRLLLNACPFLVGRIDLEGPYSAMGSTAQLLKNRNMSGDEIDQVFTLFNDLAERAETDLDLLTCGALELLNDDASIQRLARQKLRGRALAILEEVRVGWGQPDYGP